MFGEFNDRRPPREGAHNETASHTGFMEVFLHDRLGKNLPGLALSDNSPLMLERIQSGLKPTLVEVTYQHDTPVKLKAVYAIGPSTATLEMTGGLLIEYTALREQSSDR